MSKLAKKHPNLIKEHPITEIKNLKDEYSKDKTTSLLKYYDIISDQGRPDKEGIFLMAGEHPRELIAVEAAYNFIEDLVSNPNKYKDILNNYKIKFILNANPYGRMKVEDGEYCRRKNLNEVDLNRNWDIYWGKKIESLGEENPGKKPFSEVETRFIKQLLEEFKPKIFLTLHSGIYGLYMPHAFLKKEGEKNNKIMKDTLNKVKEKYCPVCHVGAPSIHIGYVSSGTCLDYTYEKLNIPYTFVWEIYTNETKFPKMEMYKLEQQKNSNKNLKGSNIKKNKLNRHRHNFMELTSNSLNNRAMYMKYKTSTKSTFTSTENDECASLFNPLDDLSVRFIKNNWTKALKFFFDNMIGK